MTKFDSFEPVVSLAELMQANEVVKIGQEPKIISWQAIDLLTQQIELCNAGASESVIVIASEDTDAALQTTVVTALERV